MAKSRAKFESAVPNASPEEARRAVKLVEFMLKSNPGSQLFKDTLAKLQQKAGQ